MTACHVDAARGATTEQARGRELQANFGTAETGSLRFPFVSGQRVEAPISELRPIGWALRLLRSSRGALQEPRESVPGAGRRGWLSKASKSGLPKYRRRFRATAACAGKASVFQAWKTFTKVGTPRKGKGFARRKILHFMELRVGIDRIAAHAHN